jgi:hypothetical protein
MSSDPYVPYSLLNNHMYINVEPCVHDTPFPIFHKFYFKFKEHCERQNFAYFQQKKSHNSAMSCNQCQSPSVEVGILIIPTSAEKVAVRL